MKYIPLLLLPVVLTFSCRTATHNKENETLLTNEINQLYETGVFNGFAVSIVNEKGTLYEKGFGFSDTAIHKPYTEKTIQNIASVSKTVVGIALLKAQELGKIDLDDPVQNYLPFTVANPAFPNDALTIRQLATHTSSIRDNEFYLSKNYYLKTDQDLKGMKRNFDEEQVFNPSDSITSLRSFITHMLSANGKWKENSFLPYKPGTVYEYSNMGTALAALIIEEAVGMPFQDFTKKYILTPLKMKESGWKFDEIAFSEFSRLYENPDTPLPYYEMITFPDGGFITSADNLSKFLTELIKGYNGNGTLLTKESYQEYFSPQLSDAHFLDRNTRNPYSESYNTGIFIGYGYTGYIGHTGGDPGVLSMMFFDPKTGLGRIMIFNTNFSDQKGNDAFYGIWNLLEKYQHAFHK